MRISRKQRIPEDSLTKAPSAELRPNQTDQDSLPPYDVLDRILKAYVEDLRSPEEIAEHYGFSLDLVRSVALQVDRNEYKRKQAPPGLKVTSKAFSVGRRFPAGAEIFGLSDAAKILRHASFCNAGVARLFSESFRLAKDWSVRENRKGGNLTCFRKNSLSA